MNKSKIFLSYAHEDRNVTEKLYHDLIQYNLDIWYDNEKLIPGQNWRIEINKAIQTCHYFIAVLSNNSMTKKGFVQKELKSALDELDLRPERDIFIIPVRIDDVQEPSHEKLKELHWIDLFPESKYKKGIGKIIKAINQKEVSVNIVPKLVFRKIPNDLSRDDVKRMLRKFDFFDSKWNKISKGFQNQYELQHNNQVVYDHGSGLMWQQSGSSKSMNYERAKNYIQDLKQTKFAGYGDWRLPTLEEAMGLMEPEKRNRNLYIDPVFDGMQEWIWTCDLVKGEPRYVWVVLFDYGYCGDFLTGLDLSCVRAVLS